MGQCRRNTQAWRCGDVFHCTVLPTAAAGLSPCTPAVVGYTVTIIKLFVQRNCCPERDCPRCIHAHAHLHTGTCTHDYVDYTQLNLQPTSTNIRQGLEEEEDSRTEQKTRWVHQPGKGN